MWRASIRWLLPACSFAVFPAAFLDALHLLLGLLAVVATAWLATRPPDIRGRAALLVVILFAGLVAPSLMVCWTPSGYCKSLGVELGYRELYLLAIALPMGLGGFACAGQAGPAYARAGLVALVSYASIGVYMLWSNDDLANRIGPARTQLFVERNYLAPRNDLAPLVAWPFFLTGNRATPSRESPFSSRCSHRSWRLPFC